MNPSDLGTQLDGLRRAVEVPSIVDNWAANWAHDHGQGSAVKGSNHHPSPPRDGAAITSPAISDQALKSTPWFSFLWSESLIFHRYLTPLLSHSTSAVICPRSNANSNPRASLGLPPLHHLFLQFSSPSRFFFTAQKIHCIKSPAIYLHFPFQGNLHRIGC